MAILNPKHPQTLNRTQERAGDLPECHGSVTGTLQADCEDVPLDKCTQQLGIHRSFWDLGGSVFFDFCFVFGLCHRPL